MGKHEKPRQGWGSHITLHITLRKRIWLTLAALLALAGTMTIRRLWSKDTIIGDEIPTFIDLGNMP